MNSIQPLLSVQRTYFFRTFFQRCRTPQPHAPKGIVCLGAWASYVRAIQSSRLCPGETHTAGKGNKKFILPFNRASGGTSSWPEIPRAQTYGSQGSKSGKTNQNHAKRTKKPSCGTGLILAGKLVPFLGLFTRKSLVTASCTIPGEV